MPQSTFAQSLFAVDWNSANNAAYTSGATLGNRAVSIGRVDTYSKANTGNIYAALWSTMFGSSYKFDSNLNQGFSYATTTNGSVTTVNLSSAVTNPYVMFTYADGPSVDYDFSGNGTSSVSSVVATTGTGTATKVGDVITAKDYGNSSLDGFIVRLNGTFSTITFTATTEPGEANDTGVMSIALDGYDITTTIGANGSGAVLGNALSPGTHTQVVEASGTETLTYTFQGSSNFQLDTANSSTTCGGAVAPTYTTSAISGSCTISAVFVADTAAPTLSSSSPADDATGVAVDGNIVLNFSEAVDVETDAIAIVRTSDSSIFETFVVTDSRVSGSGTSTITINLNGTLEYGTAYHVLIANQAFDDAAGNSYAGIGDPTVLNFTTAPDTTPPSFDVAPSVGSVTSTGFTPSASIDEAGVVYYVVVADGASAPTAAEVKAGQASGGGAALAAANSTVSSSPFTSSFTAITGLSDSTAYDVYFVAQDDEATANVQSSIIKVDVLTTDGTAPSFTFNPANAANGVAVNSNVTITASEAIRLVAGNATLDDANVDALITLKDTDVNGADIAFDATIVGNVITINPTSDFSSLQQVYVAIDGTAVEDTADNAGALTSATFTTTDTSAPTFTFNPANAATGVAVNSNITITASEAIRLIDNSAITDANVGDLITLKDTNASGTDIPFAATIVGNVITINPTSDFSSLQQVYVAIDGTAVEDTADNAGAVTSATFTVADTSAPTLASSTPADNATGVAVNSNIVLTFSEAVDTETGNIVIKKVSDNLTVESFDVATSTAISGSGTTTITINPTSDLASSTDYYIEIDTTAFDDAAGNSYAGISGATTFNFTTAAPTNAAPIANAGPDQTVASGAAVTLDGSGSSDGDGDPLTYAWTQSSGTTVTLSSTTAAQLTFTAPTLAVGDADAVLVFSLTVNDGTVSSSADTVTITVEAPSPTPATAFAEYEEEIRATLVDDARRNLTSAMSANQRLIRDARGRMIETQQALSGCNVDETRDNGRVGSELDTFECTPNSVATRNTVPFDVDGNFTLSESGLSTAGNFFQQVGNGEGTYRRLFFGDFDVQHDADTDSTTATLTGRMAWEQMTSEQTMLG